MEAAESPRDISEAIGFTLDRRSGVASLDGRDFLLELVWEHPNELFELLERSVALRAQGL